MRRHSACEVLASAPGRIDRSGASAAPIVMRAPDERAEGSVRLVTLSPAEIAIERVVAGMSMALRIPSALYEGVALDVSATGRGAGIVLKVRLAHRDPELDVVLFQAADDGDVTAEWQYWADYFGLPLLIAELDGSVTQPFPTLGALYVGEPRPRRMPAHIAKRRPRFLTRRRVGRQSDRPVVHCGREIIARD
jgi:hypothetical protein